MEPYIGFKHTSKVDILWMFVILNITKLIYLLKHIWATKFSSMDMPLIVCDDKERHLIEEFCQLLVVHFSLSTLSDFPG